MGWRTARPRLRNHTPQPHGLAQGTRVRDSQQAGQVSAAMRLVCHVWGLILLLGLASGVVACFYSVWDSVAAGI